MPQLLVRDMDADVIERLKELAKRNGRSLQGEAKSILEAAAPYSMERALQVAQAWQARLAGKISGDSTDLIREDRDR